MSRMKKWGATASVAVLVAAAAAAAYQYTTNVPAGAVVTDDAGLSAADAAGGAIAGSADGSGGGVNAIAASASDASGKSNTYIVVFKEAALASYKGTLPGIGAPERVRDEQGTMRLDAEGDNSQEYVDYLQTRQQQMETRFSLMVGRDVTPRLTMQHALNGMIVDPKMPFGGFKQSGWGREGGIEGLEPYFELKTVYFA